MSYLNRNVSILAVCVCLMMSGSSLNIATAALVGFALAEEKALSTLPLALQFIATMVTTIPAAMVMQRLGRKPAFLVGSLFGIGGAVLSSYAILLQSFWLFTTGTVAIGVFNGFSNYFRYAAIVLYLLVVLALAFLKPDRAHAAGAMETGQARPLTEIVSQPAYVVALLCGMFGYGVMTFVMTATPLAMDHSGFHFDDTSLVIQWHVLAMFAPSFVTGNLIARFGVLKVMAWGGVFGIVSITLNLLGNSLWHYLFGLISLGISWNFLFVGSTTMITDTYRPAERNKAQAVNDFAIFSTVAVAALSAGALQSAHGWQVINIAAIPLLLVILASVAWLGTLGKYRLRAT